MRLEIKKHLFDIREAALLILRFTKGLSVEGYAGDPMVRSAVERQFMSLGEALTKLSKADPLIASKVSDEYRRIISFRNVLVHEYDLILNDVVWGVATAKLPSLLQSVEELLAGE